MFDRFRRGLGWLWGWLPLTGLGWVLLGIALPSYLYFALAQKDLVLQSLCSGYLLLQLSLSLACWLRGGLLAWRLRRSPSRVPPLLEASSPCFLPFPSGLAPHLPLIAIEWRWLEPQAQVELNWPNSEKVTLSRRGFYPEVVREFSLIDLLGLARIRFRHVAKGPLQVIPGLGQLLQQPWLLHWSSGEEVSDPRGEPQGDRIDIRQYARGDSPRTILWKVYARSRRLMVRIPERSLAPRPRVCAYLVTSPQDEPAAALCRALVECDLLGPDWRLGCDGVASSAHHKAAALEHLCLSAQSLSPQPQQLAAFLQQAYQDGYGQAIVVLPMDLRDQGPALGQVLQTSPLPVLLFLAIDGDLAGQPSEAPWWGRSSSLSRQQQRLQRLSQALEGFRGPIHLIDRSNGSLVGDLRQFLRAAS